MISSPLVSVYWLGLAWLVWVWVLIFISQLSLHTKLLSRPKQLSLGLLPWIMLLDEWIINSNIWTLDYMAAHLALVNSLEDVIYNTIKLNLLIKRKISINLLEQMSAILKTLAATHLASKFICSNKWIWLVNLINRNECDAITDRNS